MYRYVERVPEKSKHITSSRPVPDGKPCDVNKHHFHGVTFLQAVYDRLLWRPSLCWLMCRNTTSTAQQTKERRVKRSSHCDKHRMHFLCTAILHYAPVSLKAVAYTNPRTSQCLCRVPPGLKLDFSARQWLLTHIQDKKFSFFSFWKTAKLVIG